MGLQTLDRAVAVLRELAAAGDDGLRLVDLQHRLRLTKPTAHRLLSSLVAHGLVGQGGESRRYRLGHELAVLGWSVSDRQQELHRAVAHSASALAEETGDTVVVVARSGFDTVCIDRRTGAYPIKALTVDIGTRRPMGVGAGSLSMLGMLPPQESDSILQAVAERLPAHTRASMAQIRAAVRVARDAGFAVSNGYVTERVRAIAVAIRDLRGDASVSLGIAAIESRIPERRIPQLVNALQRERARVETRIRSGSPPRPDPSERRAGHAVTR